MCYRQTAQASGNDLEQDRLVGDIGFAGCLDERGMGALMGEEAPGRIKIYLQS